MVKFEYSEKGTVLETQESSFWDLLTATTELISQLYNAMDDADPVISKGYKEFLLQAVNEESFLWDCKKEGKQCSINRF